MVTLPRGSWDTHCHIFQPDEHPYIDDTPYCPPAYTPQQLVDDSPSDNFVVVMSVPEGTHFEGMLRAVKALQKMGRQARSVCVLSLEQMTRTNLQGLHAAGVRSIRIHEARLRLRHHRKVTAEEIGDEMEAIAKRLHETETRWSIEAQLDLSIWSALLPMMHNLYDRYGVAFVADHVFCAIPQDTDSVALITVLNTLKEGFLWCKISGLSRFVDDFRELSPLITSIITARPDRVVWGSDSPHVKTEGDLGVFGWVDVRGQLEMLREICEVNLDWWDMLMRANADSLYV